MLKDQTPQSQLPPKYNARTLQFTQDKQAQSRSLAQVEKNIHIALVDRHMALKAKMIAIARQTSRNSERCPSCPADKDR